MQATEEWGRVFSCQPNAEHRDAQLQLFGMSSQGTNCCGHVTILVGRTQGASVWPSG